VTAKSYPRTTPTAVLPALALIAALGSGCADSTTTQKPAVDRETTTVSTTTPSPPPSSDDPTEANPMRIQITIGDQQFGATLEDSAAARDLAAQLPVTLDMVDHGGVEKTGPLPSPLSTQGEPEGADPDVGAVGYYAPGNDLVLYYGDQSYFPGIVVLGRLDDDAASRIADLDGTVTATVEAR
jgi:hypothetical protein